MAGARAAVVTGAAGAIGSAVATRLEADGFRVARTDIDGAEFTCDVRSEPDVLALRDAVGVRLGAPWLPVCSSSMTCPTWPSRTSTGSSMST